MLPLWINNFLSYFIPFWRFLPFGTYPLTRFIHSPKDLSQTYALITGASDGIGKAIATELAVAFGFNLVIHGRNQAKLERVRSEIETKLDAGGKKGRKKDIRIIVQDAAAENIDFHKVFYEPLQDLKVTLLVSNVGISRVPGTPEWIPLAETSQHEVSTVLRVSLDFPINVARALIPILAKHQPSHIVNISSFASIAPMPYLGNYAASKAGLNSFSRVLSMEFLMDPRTRHLTAQSILVGEVATSMLASNAQSFFVPPPDLYAKQMCKVIGDGNVVALGDWRHAIQWSLTKLIPSSSVMFYLFKREIEGRRAMGERAAKQK